MNFAIIHLKEIDSTNQEAIRQYESGNLNIPEIIKTDFQTAGKGNGTNVWESEKGKNLLFTIAFKPESIKPSEQFILTQIISFSLLGVLEKIIINKDITIKWPNDIYVNNKKIAGILIQNFIKNNEIDVCLIGVGLNINQLKFSDNVPNPTSIAIESGKIFELNEILSSIIKKFEENFFYAITNPQEINKKYLQNLYRFGEYHNYIIKDNKTVRGKIIGVSPYGQLILETKKNGVIQFNFKEIEFVI